MKYSYLNALLPVYYIRLVSIIKQKMITSFIDQLQLFNVTCKVDD